MSASGSPEDCVVLNICLLPPGEVSARIARLAGCLPAAGQRLSVARGERLAHLTILMAAFPRPSVPAVIEAVSELAPRQTVACTAYGITVSENGYIEVGYERTRALEILQERVAARVAGMGAHHRGVPSRHGYKLYGEAFRPHVTLAVYEDPSTLTLPTPLRFEPYDFVASTLAVTEADAYGSVSRVFRSVDLPQSDLAGAGGHGM